MNKVQGESSLDGCGQFIKYSIFIVNFLLFLGGLAILGLGIWLLVAGNDTQKIINANQVLPAVILLVFGGILAFITFMGCCGAIKEVKCLLGTFFVFDFIITILIIAGVVLLFKFKDQIEDTIEKELQKSMDKYYTDGDIRNAWDDVQRNLHCCGIKGSFDWLKYVGPAIPDSCSPWYPEGCMTKMKDELKSITTPLIGVTIAVIVILVLSMVFSCALCLML